MTPGQGGAREILAAIALASFAPPAMSMTAIAVAVPSIARQWALGQDHQ